MRIIIALSPILKLVKSRFRDKLENYMMQSQIRFIRYCGTLVNIVRLIKRYLTRYHGIKRLKIKIEAKSIMIY